MKTHDKTLKKYDWIPEPAQAADEPALLALFQRAFQHEMPVEQWRWKYARSNPTGVLVRENADVVAFYGAMPRDVLLFGKPAVAVQIGDVMVEPSRRRILTRRGPFFLAASTFSEQFVGQDKPYCYAFGFPSDRHIRLGEHLGLYARVEKIFEASWAPLDRQPALMTTCRPLRRSDAADLDLLWEEMAGALNDKVVPVRNAQYIDDRFMKHPVVDYQLMLVRRRFTGRPLGLLVLRDLQEDGVELLDVVAVPHRMPFLVHLARSLVGTLNRPRLFAWMTRPVAETVMASPCTLKETDVDVPTLIWNQSEQILEIRNHLWLMGGDSDFR